MVVRYSNSFVVDAVGQRCGSWEHTQQDGETLKMRCDVKKVKRMCSVMQYCSGILKILDIIQVFL